MAKIDRKAERKRRKLRIKYKIRGTKERPRLCVYKSLNHIYAQIIDDEAQQTIVSASTLDIDLRDKVKGCNISSAKVVGEAIAKKALEKGIDKVVFDRNGYIYHGKVKALAESAREAGLKF
ncbi:50S ribosomal protein L18 [Hippea jasoniae]|uniref:50S ribosomal protein L18 n=1 Tax=Hippea jasoniae TaxID=944479 RepID=UPI000554FC48|nr:50S ribosomal protein L18 [Hippea jasoniae]